MTTLHAMHLKGSQTTSCNEPCSAFASVSVVSAGTLYAVIPAAGVGSRMNSDTPKQYLNVAGASILTHTIDRLLQLTALKRIVVVLDKSAYEQQSLMFTENPLVDTCIGGASRAESVRNGLLHLASGVAPGSRVMVHDAARPCVRVAEINCLISEVGDDPNGGLLAMPVVDTIKRADKHMRTTETIDRTTLWRAATPQLFPFAALFDALNKALEEGIEITDEASAMQYSGYSPKLVECSADNIKVTTPVSYTHLTLPTTPYV